MPFTERKSTCITIDLLAIIAGTLITAIALNMLTIPTGLLAGEPIYSPLFLH